MSAAYTIACSAWYPAPPTATPGYRGACDLILTPPGLTLRGLRVKLMPAGLRVTFPARPVVVDNELRRYPDGTVAKASVETFVSYAAWAEFSALAIDAINAAHPGAIPLTAASTPPRSATTAPDDRAGRYTPRPPAPASEAARAAA